MQGIIRLRVFSKNATRELYLVNGNALVNGKQMQFYNGTGDTHLGAITLILQFSNTYTPSAYSDRTPSPVR